MAMDVNGGDGLQSEINVTPLVDVVLVLLIIFMVIVPLTLRGYDVEIPGEPTTEQAHSAERQVVLAIDPESCAVALSPNPERLPDDCRVNVNDENVLVTELADHISGIFDERAIANRVLFLSADDELNYEGVMRIVDVAKSGVDDLEIGLITR